MISDITGGDFNDNAALKNGSKRSNYLHKFVEENEFTIEQQNIPLFIPTEKMYQLLPFYCSSVTWQMMCFR